MNPQKDLKAKLKRDHFLKVQYSKITVSYRTISNSRLRKYVDAKEEFELTRGIHGKHIRPQHSNQRDFKIKITSNYIYEIIVHIPQLKDFSAFEI